MLEWTMKMILRLQKPARRFGNLNYISYGTIYLTPFFQRKAHEPPKERSRNSFALWWMVSSYRISKSSFPYMDKIETLFASSSSPQRKYWGFQVFRKALARLPPTDLPMLFTRNFMRSWINHMASQDRYLHKVAKQVVRS